MTTFAVEHIPEFETRQRVNKLIRNGGVLLMNFNLKLNRMKIFLQSYMN